MVVGLRVSGLSGSHWNLGLQLGRERELLRLSILQVFGLFVGSYGFLKCLSSFIYMMH